MEVVVAAVVVIAVVVIAVVAVLLLLLVVVVVVTSSGSSSSSSSSNSNVIIIIIISSSSSSSADPSGPAVEDMGLRPFGYWDCGFESRQGHGCVSVCCQHCLWSGRGLCVGLITRPEESYRVCCV